MPDYTVNKSAGVKTQKELEAYEAANRGTMRTLMEARGLGERYREIVAAQVEYDRIRQERAKRAQNSVLIMGCAGMGAIVLMIMVVFLIIALQMTGQ
jgi:Asp/Glu/hydantoin racemase